MSKFRVARFLQRDIVARVNFLNPQGLIQNSRKKIDFYPSGSIDDGWYETEDKVLIESLKDLYEQIPFSQEAEEGFKKDNVPYEYAYCPSCGGKKVRKLKYSLFEVVE